MSIHKYKLLKRSAGILLAAALATGSAQISLAEGSCKKVKQVGFYGMLPVYQQDIEQGEYEVDTQTNSTYFRMHDPKLHVTKDGMSLEFYIDSKSYGYIYPGTSQEAKAATEAEWIPADVRDGVSYFSIPVESLDSPIDCAAYSVKKKRWYDRQIMVLASSIPEEAIYVELPDYEKIEKAMKLYEEQEAAEASAENSGDDKEAVTEAETEVSAPEAVSVDMADGEYSIEVGMTGGSGRAMVTSPTAMTVKDGKAYVTLLWSSANYDYMLIDGYRYDNETTDGGKSCFTLPITAMDEPVSVVGDTTAMDEPVEINYQLTFYKDTIGDVGMIPQVAAKRVLLMALVLVVAGGILNWFVKRRLSRRK